MLHAGLLVSLSFLFFFFSPIIYSSVMWGHVCFRRQPGRNGDMVCGCVHLGKRSGLSLSYSKLVHCALSSLRDLVPLRNACPCPPIGIAVKKESGRRLKCRRGGIYDGGAAAAITF